MRLFKMLVSGHRVTWLLVMMLSLFSALLSVAVIAFIKQRMLTTDGDPLVTLMQFSALLITLFLTSVAAQMWLHTLGHRFVYRERRRLVKEVLATDVEQLEKLGTAALLAALNTDIRNITIAFVYLPELVYGLVLCLAGLVYLASLSSALFMATAFVLVIAAMTGISLTQRITGYIKQVREYDDALYRDYQSIIDGRKELALNRHRAGHFYAGEFDRDAAAYCNSITRADIFNGLAGNLANVVVLGLIGIYFYLALGAELTSPAAAAASALLILFMRGPLMGAVAALPALITANVSISKLQSLALNRSGPPLHDQAVSPGAASSGFQQLVLKRLCYTYPASNGEPGFTVGPLDLTIRRGELIFLIGGNGSGKSTFARLLTGLYRPSSGCIEIDGDLSCAARQQAFSAVFTDFHLFRQLLDNSGNPVADAEIDLWLQQLGLRNKVSHQDSCLLDIDLSHGQRKRLALMVAVLEGRTFLLLDEWAADQDPTFRRFFYRELLPTLQRRGITVIAITHDERYFDIADRVLSMERGALRELTPDERPQVARMVSSATR